MVINKKTTLLASACGFFILPISILVKRLWFQHYLTIPEVCILLGILFAVFSGYIFLNIKKYSSKDRLYTKYSQLEVIFNNAPFIIYMKDNSGNIIFANRQFIRSVKLSGKKLTGMNISEIYKNPISEKAVFPDETPVMTERCLELYNGKKHWFKVTQVPVCDTFGELNGIIVFLINTDNERKVEENKTSFVATLTHDLKTPTLAQIKASELLLTGLFGKLNDEQREIITQIKTSCNYMYDLIFTILDTYLYDNGQTKIKPEKFDIVSLVNQTVNELTNLITEKGQTINIHAASKSIYTFADKFQIKRVIVNLLGNAINYGFRNSTIDIDITDKKNNITLNVKNKSQYIPKDRIKDIFAKYKQKANAKYYKTGTGLGLYLSKQIIDAHNGKVYAKSNFNQVCDFGFKLPKKIPSETKTCKK